MHRPINPDVNRTVTEFWGMQQPCGPLAFCTVCSGTATRSVRHSSVHLQCGHQRYEGKFCLLLQCCVCFGKDFCRKYFCILRIDFYLIFVVPSIMLYSSEISPTRCNNCVLFFAMALLYMFRATISPIIRSTYAVYGQR